MKTLSPEQLHMLEDVADDSAKSARSATLDAPFTAASVAERAAVNLDQVLMELDDE